MTPKFTLSKLLDHRSEAKMESLETNGLLLPLINHLNVVDLPLITDNRAVRSVGLRCPKPGGRVLARSTAS